MSRRSVAWLLWFVFLRVHAALGVPIKGSPCCPAPAPGSLQSRSKIYPPQPSQRFLGEIAAVGSLPIHARPTKARLQNSRSLLLHIRSSQRLLPGLASTAVGKLRFLAGSLYGRVAISPLAVFYERQHQSCDDYTPAIEASVLLLLDLLEHVGPRDWTWGVLEPTVFNLFGDASEPGVPSAPRICAGVLQDRSGKPLRFFAVQVPPKILTALEPRCKQICFLELLWPLLAAILWSPLLNGSHVLVFEDNQSAQHGLRRGMSCHVDLNALLALFWCGASHHRCRYWFDYIPSAANPADCLTKPGLNMGHLQGAVDDSDHCDWGAVFTVLHSCLVSSAIPRWCTAMELFATCRLPHFQ